jgi:hypothetical protein
MNQVDPKKVTFSFSEKEWLEAVAQYQLIEVRRILKHIIIALIGINLVKGYWIYSHPDQHKHYFFELFYTTLCGVVGATIWFLIARWLRLRRAKKNMAIAPETLSNHSWELSDDGILNAGPKSQANFDWKFFKKAHLSKDHLFVERRDYSLAHVCPRRVFSDRGQIWYNFISEKILKHKT